MKLSRLIFWPLSYYKKNRFFFITMAVSLLLSSLVVIMCFGTLRDWIQGMLDSVDVPTFRVQNYAGFTLGKVAEMDYSAYGVDSFQALCEPDFLENPVGVITSGGPEQAPTAFDCSRYYWTVSSDNNPDCVIWRGKGSFIGRSAPGVILPMDKATGALEYDPSTDSFGTLHLDGKDYDIVGITTDSDNIYADYSVADLHAVPKHVSFRAAGSVGRTQGKEFQDLLFSVFRDGPYAHRNKITPYSYVEAAESKYSQYAVLFLFLYLVSLVSFSMIISYLTGTNLPMYYVFYSCGASRSLLCIGLLLQNLLLTTAAWLSTFTVYSLTVYFVRKTVFSLPDVAAMLAIVWVCTAVVSLPGMASILTMNPARVKNGKPNE